LEPYTNRPQGEQSTCAVEPIAPAGASAGRVETLQIRLSAPVTVE